MIHSTFLASLVATSEGGFNPLDVGGAGNFLWTIIIFVAALYPMWKMVFSKITESMENRDARAAEAIIAAERASVEAEKSRAAVEVALGEAHAEAAKLLVGARERAESRERDIIENAEQDKALSAIRDEVVELSLHAASQVLGRSVGTEDDRRLVSELVAGAKAGQA